MPKLGLWAGEVGRARYRVVCALAAGGMGHVDLVVRQDGGFARLFAQKRLRAHLIDDPSVRRMFLDEGRIAGLVRHPHVVSVVDVGEDDAGPYLVMDFVEGVSLAQLVARAAASDQPVPMSVALRIAVQVADGLHAVHETRGGDGELLQLIHRDVSPQNVLIAFDGTARVSDFGIAKALGRATRTTAGVLKGKVGYLAPERLRFEQPDLRADLFSFGVVLYELLTRRRLYDGADDSEAARRILNEPPPDLGDQRDDAAPELVELLFELLAKDRDCRPVDAGLVARRLERILAVTLDSHQDSVDVGAYVGGLFAAERESLRARIRATLEGAAGEGAEFAQVTPGARPARARTLVAPRRLAWGALAGASGMIAVFAIAAGPRTHRPVPAVPAGPEPAMTGGMTAGMTAGIMAATTAPASGSAVVSTPTPTPPLHAAHKRRWRRTARATVDRSERAVEGCDPPYTLNAAGERQFKMRCLVDVRR